MVEFKLKTIAEQDTSIDKGNPDLYDGGSGYITVGDKAEPKLGLFRFKIAAKPNYGDATLKHGQMGFYNLSTSSYSGTNIPQFAIYKMKTSSDGTDWGAGGSINPVKRGKVITGASTSTNYITVEDHQLRTGEPMTWSPFVRFYGDAVLTGISREVEYFAIRIDDNTLQFASTVALAMAGTAVSITTATPVLFANVNVKPNISENRYGYLRSKKYRSDIHVVSSWGENYESVVENFDGSKRRESELDFQSVQRQVTRRDAQHLLEPFPSKLYKSKTSTEADCTHTKPLHFATRQADGTWRIYLRSHKTNADGGGWWRTEKDDDGDMHVVPKMLPQNTNTPNPNVKYEGEHVFSSERYGDEVTPANSIFHTVRGAKEFQQGAEEEGGTNVLQATGAVRFSSEKKLTGGQSCNFYNFWKMDAIGVEYTSTDGKMSEKFKELKKGQECMVQYKNLPCPTITMNTGVPCELSGYEGPGQLPLGSGDTESAFDGQTTTIKITMNLAALAKAYTTPDVAGAGSIVTTADDIILSRRAMFVCLAETPVGKGESLYQYIRRLGGTTWADNTHITTNTVGNKSAVGFWIVNTSLGIQVFSLCRGPIGGGYKTNSTELDWHTFIDTGNEDFYVKNILNSTAGSSGLDNDQYISTGLGEDEWADWCIRIAPNIQSPNLHIVAKDGMELLPVGTTADPSDFTETANKRGIALYNIKQETLIMPTTGVNTGTNTFTYTAHGLVDGDAIIFNQGGSPLLTGLTADAVYYAKISDANNFQLYDDKNLVTIRAITGTGNNTQFFQKIDVGKLPHDPSTWTKNLSIWTCNAKSAYSVNTAGNPEDYLHGEEDADMEHNIFIDSISVNGINVAHQNNTRAPNEPSYNHSPITITGGKVTNATYASEEASQMDMTGSSSMARIEKTSDSVISLGFEDPSQISSHHQAKKSWRYLYWQGYQSSNLSSDGPIAWTAGNTLPSDTYMDTSSSGDEERDWFTAVDTSSSTTARYDEANSQTWYHDAGSPFTYSPQHSLISSAASRSAPSWVTSYSDAHVSLGAQFSNEALNHRNLYFNRTTAAVANDRVGGAGAGQRMFTTMPHIGILFRGQTDVSSDIITINKGSFGATEHNWNAGHKVVYYNNGKDSIGGIAPVSCDNSFRDTPVVYYIDYVSATSFKLTTSYEYAIAGTNTISLTDSTTDDGLHCIYDYDYYVNNKYWMNGWESKGLSRLMLQPTLNATSAIIKANYIDNKGNGGNGAATAADTDVETDETTLYLTKRENIQCSAKVLEVERVANNAPSRNLAGNQEGIITLTVDTTDCLQSVPGTTYRAYLIANGTITAGTPAYGGYNRGEEDTTNFKSGLHVNIIDSNSISISNWNGLGSTGSVDLLSDDNISNLWIGPEKYWVFFKVMSRTGDTSNTYRPLPNKTYTNVCVVSPYGGGNATDVAAGNDTAVGNWANSDAWGTPGATYNESVANFETVAGIPSAYTNKWEPVPSVTKSQTIFDLEDYGFGGVKQAESGDNLAINNTRGGNVASFVPRDSQINLVNMFKVFNTGAAKVPGDYIDLALSAEDLSVDSTLTISSSDNPSLPKPFLLTVYEDAKPANPTDFKVFPNKNDAFFPEFSWSAGDADLWYGFIIIDDKSIDSQYHGSILHAPLDEDLRTVASKYDNEKGWYYESASDPVIYGYRYYNTSLLDSDRRPLDEADASVWATNFALKDGGTEKTTAKEVKLYDNVEGLAGNTKYFDKDGGSYIEFPFNTTSSTGAAASAFTYPKDEMSVIAHIVPTSWADSTERAYIASFNESTDATAAFDAWGIYMDDAGKINAFIAAQPADTTPATWVQLKSTTKVPIDGTPTSIILTIDTQLHHGNMKLFINGRLEDQTGLRKSTVTSNNWPTHSSGIGGEPIHFDTNSTTAGLFIGAKAQDGSEVGQSPFNGKIEEFVWYDKTIFPIVPQNGKFILEKPLEELVSGSTTSSSKSHTARLFVKDYHNIRGKTTGEVAASSQVSFKKAAFELYT